MRGLHILHERRFHKDNRPNIERIYECEYGLIHVPDDGGNWQDIENEIYKKALDIYIEIAKTKGEIYEDETL